MSFISYIDPAVPEHLYGDANRIHQILTNLMGNAVKFTHTGEIVLEVTKLSVKEDTYRFKVSDTGIGIPNEHFDHLFDPFSADESTTRRYGGTGLGLSIVKHLVELMGSVIHVSSQLGKGSCFSFDLEVTKNRDPATGKRHRPNHVREACFSMGSSSPKMLSWLMRCWAIWGWTGCFH